MTSDTVNLTDMSELAYWKVRARLLRVPGVAQVAIWGNGSSSAMSRSTRRSLRSTTSPCSR